MPSEQHHCLVQLRKEYDSICFQYSLRLPPPGFDLTDNRRQVASWQPHPAPGRIAISSLLIDKASWDVVVEVLKHEVCHQYAWLMLGGDKEPPHGPAFQRAAGLLGLHPLLRRASGEIPEFIPGYMNRLTSQPPPLFRKIEKLLALAESSNRHEAALAMSKCGELIRRYNIQPADNPASHSDYDYLLINSGNSRRSPWTNYILSILKRFFFVDTVSYKLYQPADNTHSFAVELLGRRENLLIAEYVYHFLENQLFFLWNQHRRKLAGQGKWVSGREKNSYFTGILEGFSRRLEDDEHNSPLVAAANNPQAGKNDYRLSSSFTQMVCGEDTGLKQFIASRYPRLYKVKGRGRRLYSASYQEGKAAGYKLQLKKSICQKAGNLGRLLG